MSHDINLSRMELKRYVSLISKRNLKALSTERNAVCITLYFDTEN
jgi:hypothetical protein